MSTLILLYVISWSIHMITVLLQMPQTFYRWTKIITALLFVIIGILNFHPVMLITLMLFFSGDVLLAFANGGTIKHWLMWGMLCFWLGHIGLIFYIISCQTFEYLSLIMGMILIFLMLVIKKKLTAIDFRGLFPILLVYGYTLGILGSLAILGVSASPLLTSGILIFIVSDICLIFWYFYPQCPKTVKILNVITYFGAVLLIALS